MDSDTWSATVAKNVRAIRQGRGELLSDLSRRLADVGHPLSIGTLSKMETGRRTITVDDLVALTRALHVNTADLLATADNDPDEDLVEEVEATMTEWWPMMLQMTTVLYEIKRLQQEEQRIEGEIVALQETRDQIHAQRETILAQARKEGPRLRTIVDPVWEVLARHHTPSLIVDRIKNDAIRTYLRKHALPTLGPWAPLDLELTMATDDSVTP